MIWNILFMAPRINSIFSQKIEVWSRGMIWNILFMAPRINFYLQSGDRSMESWNDMKYIVHGSKNQLYLQSGDRSMESWNDMKYIVRGSKNQPDSKHLSYCGAEFEYSHVCGLTSQVIRLTPSWSAPCTLQLMEMFNVVDYPVLGYTPPKIVTELHTHIWGCAIDYRYESLGG